MALRVFKCRVCGHRTRFTTLVCGNCLSPKPVWQTTGFYGVAASAIFLTVVIALI